MRLLYYLAYITGAGVFTLLTWKFYGSIFRKAKVQKDTELLCFSLYFTLTIVLQQFVSSAQIQLNACLLLLALLTMLYQDHWTKKVFAVLSLSLFSTLIHYELIFLSGRGNLLLFQPESFNSIIGITLECFFFYLFVTLIIFTWNYLHNNIAAAMNWTVAFILPLCAAFLLCVSLTRTERDFDSPFFFSILLLVTVNLIALFSYWHRALKTRVESVAYQNKFYKNQLEIIETSEASLKSLRHDLENHMLILSDLLKEENLSEAREYLAAVRSQLDASRVLSNTGNSSIDSLVNYKLRALADSDVHLDYQAEIPSKLGIDAFDLTIILGNLLDNALEALERLPASTEKNLSLHLKYDRGRLLIKISNTYDGRFLSSASGLLTRKKNPSAHGIGLKNVRAAADKYQGYMKTACGKDLFTACVIIYEPSSQG